MMLSITMISVLALGQTVEFAQFPSTVRYMNTTGTPSEVSAFYQEWKRTIDPNWQKNSEKFWYKHDEMIQIGMRFPLKKTYLAYDISDRRQLWAFVKTAWNRNCTLIIRGSLDPFGRFSLHISPRIVGFVLIGIFVIDLMGFVVWVRYWYLRKAARRGDRSSLSKL